ncbi:MAG: N-acetylmuramic acid 6-phosphate etherase [Phycisphaerales bacterium JB038]
MPTGDRFNRDSTHPPDRSGIDTEQRNPRSAALDTLSVRQCVELINEEDRTVPEAVRGAVAELSAFIEAATANMRRGGRLIYIGAGTSGRLGVLDASECPPTFQSQPEQVVGIIAGGDSALRRSSESREDDPQGALPELDRLDIGERDTLLGIAAGSTTPYVLGALALAQQRGATTGLLCCSEIERPAHVEHLMLLRTGPEIITGSTRMKAGTATKLALNTITTTIMVQLGKVYGNLMVDLRATNAKLRDRAARIVGELTGLPREESFALLERAEGQVKQAVVMHQRGVDHKEAQRLLDLARGDLRTALANEDRRS